MSIIDNIKNATQSVTESGADYVEATQSYVELKIFQHIALSFSLLVKILLVGGLFLWAFILATVTGILLVNEVVNNLPMTLLYFSTAFLLLGILVFIFRKKLFDNAVVSKLSQTFFTK